jgi:glycosyltransferase involved in cell wall biosynthesis
MATIIGKGEEEREIKQKIKDLKLTDRIYIAGYKKNLLNYFLNSKFFILTSLWEDPGFVLIEAAMCNLILISSDCTNGPSEFLNFGKAGFLYKSNSASDLNLKILEALNADKNTIKTMKFLAKKNCLKYTKFKHFNRLRLLLN